MKWEKDKWDTGDCHNVAEDCSWSETYGGATIYIVPEVWAIIRQLCKDVKVEWQMLLCGEEKDTGVYVSGYWIPKQEVTSSTVTNLDVIDSKVIKDRKIVATIHSHANMGVFFSSTDTQFTNLSLVKNHIVTNNKGDMCATTRHSLPCGLDKFFDCNVELSLVSAEIENRDHISEKIYVPTYLSSYYHLYRDEEKAWDTDKRKMRSKKKHALLDEEQEYLFKGGKK